MEKLLGCSEAELAPAIDSLWETVDTHGNSVLHLAILHDSVSVTRAILASPHFAQVRVT